MVAIQQSCKLQQQIDQSLPTKLRRGPQLEVPEAVTLHSSLFQEVSQKEALAMSVNLNLDDLGSFDGSDSGLKTPESPRSPQIAYDNPVGLTIGETAPSSPNRSVASAGSHGRNQSHSEHGVHMHKQENARVPLLIHSVDRSNSSRSSYPPELTEDNPKNSIAEIFLNKESKYRQNMNMNYAGLNSLLEDTGSTGSNGSSRRPSADGSYRGDSFRTDASTEDEAQMEIDALAAAVDPTPWSEIERKMTSIQESVAASLARYQHQPPASHPHHYNYYPYGRHQQLPIPEKMPSPPQNANAPPPAPPNYEEAQQQSNAPTGTGTMARALATAAAIASAGTAAPAGPAPAQAQAPAGPIPAPSEAVPAPAPPVQNQGVPDPTRTAQPPSDASARPYTKAQQTPANGTKPAPMPAQQYQPKRQIYTAPQHATAHSTSRASVLEAANKKSQYGFGGNHVIPSVPAPPPTATTKGYSNSSNHPPPPVASITTDSASNSGAAYERKKQRAKDARIKLNDAIERLSIAMSLAGSQSKQRVNLLGSRISKTEQRNKSIQISDECVKLAEQAKKWDRPSFVGTAASLVQALNSQCESLSRELVCLQERLDATAGSRSGVPGSVPLPPEQENSAASHKRQEHPTPGIDGSHVKRIKAEDNEELNEDTEPVSEHVEVPEDDNTIYSAVAKMLDPVSLSRCPCVSRQWRDMKAFQDDSTWMQLAVQRFGFYNVRQWAEKLADGDGDADGDGTKVSQKALYRAMNAANVMPHMQQEGMALLGDAKIPGRISGWVFMVERSNGETLRSVKREPSTATPGAGAYQSRPVVELQLVIQNTGMAHYPVMIKNQQITVDVSTRRSGGELSEIYWDDRFTKAVKNLDGSRHQGGKDAAKSRFDVQGELCRLDFFESVMINVHIDAKGCSTTSKFRQRSNFTKILVSLEGTTVPMVIPFLRDGSQGH